MRKGLFLSRHHGGISSVVDVDKLARKYADLTSVKVYNHFFGKTEQLDILKQVRENNLEAVVLAGYSVNQFEIGKEGRAFVRAIKKQGINQNRIVFTNLYEQVALIHSDRPEDANRKAGLLIDTAIAKADHCHAVESVKVEPVKAVLVIGTTTAGLVAANELLSQQYTVYVVEPKNTWRVYHPESQPFGPLIERLKTANGAALFFGTEVADFSGLHGDYSILLKGGQESREINVGGVFLCPGKDREWIEQLRPLMRLDTDREGLIVNAKGEHATGPTKDPGIWAITPEPTEDPIAGLKESVRQASLELTASLDARQIEHPVLVSEVDETMCGGCGTCVKTCAFSASTIDAIKKISVIDAKRCKGCGNCVTACPTNARDLVTFPTLYVNQAIDILSQGGSPNGDPKILAFLCKNSGYMAADAAGDPANQPESGNYSPNVMPLRIECGGNIDTVYILKALKQGFDGVAMVICKDNHCHNIVGNTDMERRIGLLRAVLRSRHLDDDRMRIIPVYGHEGTRLNEELKAFSDDLKRLNRQ